MSSSSSNKQPLMVDRPATTSTLLTVASGQAFSTSLVPTAIGNATKIFDADSGQTDTSISGAYIDEIFLRYSKRTIEKIDAQTATTGTYSANGTTITVTISAGHNLQVGQKTFLDITSRSSGTDPIDLEATVLTVTPTTFTAAIPSISGTITGKKMEVRYEAYGKGQAVRGLNWKDKRPDVVIVDDCQDREDAKSDTVLESDWEWFLSDIMFLGNEGGSRIFMIGNNLGEKCIIERIFKNAKQLGFKCEKTPICVDNKPSWPARDTMEKINKIKQDYQSMGKLNIFYEEMMCESMSDELKIFTDNDFRYYSPNLANKLTEDTNIFATLDWAVSKDRRSACYRAIVVNAVNEENFWHILDVPFGYWDPKELIDQMFNVVIEYKANFMKFGIEKGIFAQAIEPFLNDEMIRRNIFFEVVPVEHAREGSKLERVKMLQPRFKSGQVLFPDYAPYNEETKTDWLTELKHELGGVTRDGFKSEYVDLVDALAMQIQVSEPPVRTSTRRFVNQPQTSDGAVRV